MTSFGEVLLGSAEEEIFLSVDKSIKNSTRSDLKMSVFVKRELNLLKFRKVRASFSTFHSPSKYQPKNLSFQITIFFEWGFNC